MDKHGRLTEDYGNLRHHHAGPGERLTTEQRKDNARYNAAVHARAEMLDSFGDSPNAPRNQRGQKGKVN